MGSFVLFYLDNWGHASLGCGICFLVGVFVYDLDLVVNGDVVLVFSASHAQILFEKLLRILFANLN